jgi:hypothetical protein
LPYSSKTDTTVSQKEEESISSFKIPSSKKYKPQDKPSNNLSDSLKTFSPGINTSSKMSKSMIYKKKPNKSVNLNSFKKPSVNSNNLTYQKPDNSKALLVGLKKLYLLP